MLATKAQPTKKKQLSWKTVDPWSFDKHQTYCMTSIQNKDSFLLHECYYRTYWPLARLIAGSSKHLFMLQSPCKSGGFKPKYRSKQGSYARQGLLIVGSALAFQNHATPMAFALASSKKKKSSVPNNLHRPALSKDCHALQDAHANGIVIRPTRTMGLSAFVGEGTTFKAGAWIGEYLGEIHTRREVEARYWNLHKSGVTDRRWKKSRKQRHQGMSGDYLFDMGNDLFVDGEDADVSSWCRFMNHASESIISTNGNADNAGSSKGSSNVLCNVETKCSRLVADVANHETIQQQPRLWFVARRDIGSGEELLYDYGDSYWHN